MFVRIFLNSTKERLTSLRKTYEKILKEHFYKHLISKREELQLSQVKMADKLLGAYERPELLTDDEALWAFIDDMAKETNALLKENGHFGG